MQTIRAMGSGFYTHFEEPIRGGMRISEESNQRNPVSAAWGPVVQLVSILRNSLQVMSRLAF